MTHPLYTLHEARIAFCRSAVDVIEAVGVPRMRLYRLLAGRGGRKGLRASEKSVVYSHWALLADLQLAGHGWAIDDELEGLISCLEGEGPRFAVATVLDQLSLVESADLDAAA